MQAFSVALEYPIFIELLHQLSYTAKLALMCDFCTLVIFSIAFNLESFVLFSSSYQ